MATRSNRRSSPADVAFDGPVGVGFDAGLDPALEGEEAQTIAQKPKFTKYLAGLTPAECEEREVWIYRVPLGSKPGTKPARLEIIPLPTDTDGYECLDDYLQSEWGGGDFEIYLKIKGPGRNRPNDHHGWIKLEGPSKFRKETIVLDGRTGQPMAAPAGGGAAVGPSDASTIAGVLRDVLQREKNNPLAEAGETLKVLSGLRQELAPAGPPPPNELDQLEKFAKLIKALTPAPAPVAPVVNPFQEGLAIVKQVKDFMGEVAPAAAPVAAKASGLLGGLSAADLVTLAGGDKSFLRDVLIGAPEAEGLGAAVSAWLLGIIKTRPNAPGELFDTAMQGIRRFTAPTAAAGTVASVAVTPRLGDGAAAVEGTTVAAPVAVPGEATALPPQAVMDDALGMIARAFENGRDGTDVAIGLNCFYPLIIPDLTQLFTMFDDGFILEQMKQQPAIAGILPDVRFAQFYTELKETILQGFEDGEEEEESEELPAAPFPAVSEPVGAQ